MSLFLKGLILDEIDFGFDERISENDDIYKDTYNGEEDLECNLTWRKVWDKQEDGICNDQAYRNES